MKLFKICDCCKKKKFWMDIQIGGNICNNCASDLSEVRKYPQHILDYVIDINKELANE